MITSINVRVLPANWLDLFQLRELERLCFKADAWPMLELLAVLTFPGVVRLKAVLDQRMVGFIAGDKTNGQKVGWILTLGVLPDYRRFGIASMLLNECEARMHHPLIKLSVRSSNSAAIKLYQHRGYHQVDIWKNYYRDGEDGLVFEKSISN